MLDYSPRLTFLPVGVDVVEAVDGSAKELLKDLLGLEAEHVASGYHLSAKNGGV